MLHAIVCMSIQSCLHVPLLLIVTWLKGLTNTTNFFVPPHNNTKQYAFIFVSLEDITMGCTTLKDIEFRFEIQHPMIIFSGPTIT